MTPYRPIFRRALTLAAVCTLGGGVVTFALAPAAGASGDTWYVAESGNDGNNCSSAAPCKTIQHAIFAASAGDTVSIAAGTYPERFEIERSITIQGESPDTTFLTSDSTSGDLIRIYHDAGKPSPDVTIDGVTVSGAVSAPGIAVDGVDVAPAMTTLTVSNAIVTNNGGRGIEVFTGRASISNSTVSNNGGDAGVYADGSAIGVTIGHSVISENSKSGVHVEKGWLQVDASTIVGNELTGITAQGTATSVQVLSHSFITDNVDNGLQISSGDGIVRDSVLSRNGSEAWPGAGISFSSAHGDLEVTRSTVSDSGTVGILFDGASLTVDKSTVSGNGAEVGSSGSAGIEAQSGSLDVTASTIAGNGAAGVKAGVQVTAAQIYQSTIAGNAVVYAPAGGLHYVGHGNADVGASIIANNASADCVGAINDVGYNLSSDSSCGFSNAKGSIPNGNPKLGTLANNGGHAQTMALGAGSDALDKIPGDAKLGPPPSPQPLRALGHAFLSAIPADMGSTCLNGGATDQRGVGRPQNGKCDIGAYELQQSGGGSRGGGGTTSQTTTPTTSPTPTPTNSPSPAADSVPPSTTNSMSVTADPSQATMIAKTEVVGLAQTGVGIDRFAAAGILVLATGVLLLFGLAYRDVGRRH